MAFDGNGSYALPSPQYPAIAGSIIYASDFNTIVEDIQAALNLAWTRDGQSAATANIPLGGFKLTGMGNGVNATDSVTYGQAFNSPAFNTPTAAASPALGDNSLALATTFYVMRAVAGPLFSSTVAVYSFLNF